MKYKTILSVAMVTSFLAACGGGGSDSGPSTPSTSGTLSGVAAVGSPIVNGAINVSYALGTNFALCGTGHWRHDQRHNQRHALPLHCNSPGHRERHAAYRSVGGQSGWNSNPQNMVRRVGNCPSTDFRDHPIPSDSRIRQIACRHVRFYLSQHYQSDHHYLYADARQRE